MIELPWPPKQLSPNARVHWSTKAKWTKLYRSIAYGHAIRSDMRPREHGTKVYFKVTFCPPDRRHRDSDNMIGMFKSYRDGLSDAWEINDRRFWPDYKLGEPVKGGKIVVSLS